MTGNSNNGKNDLSFPGKIAIVTSPASFNLDDFHSCDTLIAKYGPEKIIHLTWMENPHSVQDQMLNTISKLAEDRDVKTLIINQAVYGCNYTVEKLKEKRDDIFVIYRSVHDAKNDIASSADLIFRNHELGMGPAIVDQAKKQGAKAFVHYSFPRHMAINLLSGRRDIIRDKCIKEGIRFVDATVLDPIVDYSMDFAKRFIYEDVKKLVEQYGEDTAFFCTNCHLQPQLIESVMESHAIFPQPCCPSPFHGFPEALGINMGDGMPGLRYFLNEACRIAEEKNMTDRLSTWPVSTSMLCTNAGAEYAIKWIKGDVPKKFIDNDVLLECMDEYIMEIVGEESNVSLTAYQEDGKTHQNFKLLLLGYLDF